MGRSIEPTSSRATSRREAKSQTRMVWSKPSLASQLRSGPNATDRITRPCPSRTARFWSGGGGPAQPSHANASRGSSRE